MKQYRFTGATLITYPAKESFLRDILPHQFRWDFDDARSRRRTNLDHVPGKYRDGFRWTVTFSRESTAVSLSVTSEKGMSYQEMRAFEDRYWLRRYPDIYFYPSTDDEEVQELIDYNRSIERRWDTDLLIMRH